MGKCNISCIHHNIYFLSWYYPASARFALPNPAHTFAFRAVALLAHVHILSGFCALRAPESGTYMSIPGCRPTCSWLHTIRLLCASRSRIRHIHSPSGLSPYLLMYIYYPASARFALPNPAHTFAFRAVALLAHVCLIR